MWFWYMWICQCVFWVYYVQIMLDQMYVMTPVLMTYMIHAPFLFPIELLFFLMMAGVVCSLIGIYYPNFLLLIVMLDWRRHQLGRWTEELQLH